MPIDTDHKHTTENNVLFCLLLDIKSLDDRVQELNNRNPAFDKIPINTLLKERCLSVRYFTDII